MRRFSLVVFILLGSLALVSCSNSPTLSESVKLIEYEKCLSAEEAKFIVLTQNSSEVDVRTFFQEQAREEALINSFIDACKELRP